MKMSSSQQISDVINTEKNNLILGNNHISINNNNNYKYNNCVAIRQEIQRFESVHPSIYAIYDLLELNSDQVLSLRIREHLLSIEDSFVNSQEWTLSRTVPDLRLGILGSIDSGKSALVHRYLTGSYMQDESPEGGRFKKEVFVQGQSNMLLIRDEGGPPEMQFSCWVDAVIFVFSVDNLESFETVKEYYQKLLAYRNNIEQVPLILVGTKDTDNDILSSMRVIDEISGHQLAEEMHKNCHYYETCATLGQNVEKVFQDACQRIIEVRSTYGTSNECSSPANSYTALPNYLNNPVQTNQSFNTFSSLNLSRPTTPHNQTRTKPNNNNYINNCYNNNGFNRQTQSPLSTFSSNYQTSPNTNNSNLQSTSINLNNSLRKTIDNHQNKNKSTVNSANLNVSNLTNTKVKEQQFTSFNTPIVPKRIESKHVSLDNNQVQNNNSNNFSSTLFTPISTIKEALQQNCPNQNVLPISTIIGGSNQIKANHNTPNSNNNCTVNTTTANKNNNESSNTPSCTPNINRKTRRRSNLFSVSSSKNKNLEEKCRNGELGSGRTIPLRQGYLHKKSVNSSLNTKLSLKNKEWKKKYVTLTTDGCLTYHPSLHDYMNDTHGKKISLMHTTVKIPGQKPRGSSIISSNVPNNTVEGEFNKLNLINNTNNQNNYNEVLIDGSLGNYDNGRCVNCGIVFSNSDDRRLIPITNSAIKDKDSSSSKKKHRRLKSNQLANAVITTNAYCERCATLLENGNGFASTFVANNSTKNSSDSTNSHEEEDFVFVIVSLDNKQWHFQAQSSEDRENWLQAIENQILLSLQNIQSDKEKLRNSNSEQSNNEKIFKDQIRQIAGNNYCLDCDATNPTWASLNLGGLICIECSGIHRNLGTHISKVRSLDLDDWPEGNIAVMLSLGNTAVNKIWECNTKNLTKPVPTSSRDEKEIWVRRKYERKEFLCTLNDQIPINDQLEISIKSGDLRQVFNLLSHVNPNLVSSLNQINCKPLTDSNGNQNCTLLQLAVSTNNIGIAQLLIWCLGNINATDTKNLNALSYAKTKEMKDFLRSQGCTENKKNNKTTLDSNNSSIAKNLNQNLSTNNSNNFNMFDQLPTSII